MEQLYSEDVLTLATGENKADFSFDSDVFERAAAWIRERGGFTPEMLLETPARAVIDETFRILGGAVSSSVSTEMPDDLVDILRSNTFVFSGLKTFHSLSDVGLSLVGEDGGIKPFGEFHRDVVKIDEKYNRNYLEAEYNYAVSSSQMASKWQDFEADGDRYDLQYRTAGDDKVRAEHRRLDNITLPASDPFWKQFLPPNGWNCRCTVAQVRKGKYPTSDSARSIEIGEEVTSGKKQLMFRSNPGIDLTIFPDKHPYNKAPQVVKEILPKKVSKEDYQVLKKSGRFSKIMSHVREKMAKEAVELDDFEKSAIRYYTDDGFTPLNQYNRGSLKDEEFEKFLKPCSKVLSNAIIKKGEKYEGLCFRGARLTDDQISIYKKHLVSGKPLTEKGYLSASYDQSSSFKRNVRYEIISKRGVKVEDLSKFKEEKEILFDRGTKFKINKIEAEDGITTIEMEEI